VRANLDKLVFGAYDKDLGGVDATTDILRHPSEVEMVRVSMFLAVGVVVLSAPAVAQQPARDNPDVLRPPVLVSFPVATRQREVVRLYFAELRRAMQTADTTTLSVLVPDLVIPADEKLNARRAGCPSLGAAMNRPGNRGAPVGGPNTPRLDQVHVLPAAQGDTVAFGNAQLTINGRTSELSVALTRLGNARSMGRVRGLLTALCSPPAMASGSSIVGNAVPR